MKILVNGNEIGTIVTNHSLTIEEAMYAFGYDITSKEDCEKGYEEGIPGFYLDDEGNYCFDVEAAELVEDNYFDLVEGGMI